MPAKRIRSRPRSSRRRGAALLEFASVVPILFLLVFVSLEFGRMNMVYHAMEDAAYEGARKGLVSSSKEEDIRRAALSVLNATGVRNPAIRVKQSDETVTVSISIDVKQESWVTPIAFYNVDTLAAVITLYKK